MTQGPCVALRQGLRNAKIFKSSQSFHDKTQERNAEERKDRIRVYPCVALCCDEHQCEGDAT